MKVDVTVGVGFWIGHTVVDLVAAPHVGDRIVVGEQIVQCDRVTIDADCVFVFEKLNFQSEQEAKAYFNPVQP